MSSKQELVSEKYWQPPDEETAATTSLSTARSVISILNVVVLGVILIGVGTWCYYNRASIIPNDHDGIDLKESAIWFMGEDRWSEVQEEYESSGKNFLFFGYEDRDDSDYLPDRIETRDW